LSGGGQQALSGFDGLRLGQQGQGALLAHHLYQPGDSFLGFRFGFPQRLGN
jgi:hypothetical protein